MKLRLPHVLLSAVLAAVGIQGGLALAETPDYSGIIYTYKGVTSGKELAFSILEYVDGNGATQTISGRSGNWVDIQAAIATVKTDNSDQNTLKFVDGSTTTALTYTFNPIAVAGFIVDAEGYSIKTTDNNTADRNIYIGNTNGTAAYTTINYSFTLSNANSTTNIHLKGEQTWYVADTATYTLNAGSNKINLAEESRIEQVGGIVDFSEDQVTGAGCYTVSSGALKKATFATGTTLALTGSSAVELVTMKSGSTLDLTSIDLGKLAEDAYAVNGKIDVSDGVLVELSGIASGSTVALFSGDSSIGDVTFTVDGHKINHSLSDIAKENGIYTFNSLRTYSLLWSGGASGTWNSTNTSTWQCEHFGTETVFVSGDTVTFNTSSSVDVSEGVEVAGMTVTGSDTVLSMTLSNSGYIKGDVTVTDGATLILGTQTNTTGFVRGDIVVEADSTLQFNANDITGYNGGANSTQNITVASGAQLLLNHGKAEQFTGTLVLNGTMKGQSNNSTRLDLCTFGTGDDKCSAKVVVEDGNHGVFQDMILCLRQDLSEVSVGKDATLSVHRLDKWGNARVLKKTGEGALNISGKTNANGINLELGSVAMYGGGTPGVVNISGNGASITFGAADTATTANPTTYTVTSINTKDKDNYTRSILVEENAKVTVTNLINAWGLKSLTVDGVLEVTEKLEFATGSNTMGEANIINGSGSITTKNLNLANVGRYTFESVALTVSEASTIGENTQGTQVKSGTIDFGALTLKTDSMSILGGEVSMTSTAAAGKMLTVLGGTLHLGEGTHTFGSIDASVKKVADASINVHKNATLTFGKMWISDDSALTLGMEEGTITIRGLSDTVEAVITGSGEYGMASDAYRFENASIDVESAASVSLQNAIIGGAVKNSGTAELKLTNGYNNLTEINAECGNINIQWVDKQGDLERLVIGEGRTVGYHQKTQDHRIDLLTNQATMTVTEAAYFGAGAALYANLHLASTVTLSLEGSLHMGSTLTLTPGMELIGSLLEEIFALEKGDTVTLFTGVQKLVIGTDEYTKGVHFLTKESGVDFGYIFSNSDIADDTYYVGYDAEGTVYVGLIPEPATATLSLLALAALAARRRRGSH